MKLSAFSVSLKLFQAQSLLGVVGIGLPFDSKFDRLRQLLFEASLKIADCSSELNSLYNESE